MNEFNTSVTPASNLKPILASAGIKPQRDALLMLPFESITILPDFNVRDHNAAWQARVEAIAADMAEVGWRKSKPMEVLIEADGRVIATDAHTRYYAAQLARSKGATNLDLVPAIALDKDTTDEDLTIGLIKNNDGERLDALGTAIVVKRMVVNHGRTLAEAGSKLGFSPKYAQQMFLLSEAPEILKQMIRAGQVSATLVIETIEQYGPEEAVKILQTGLEKAQAKGKTKVRAKNTQTPEQKMEKALKDNAAAMYQLMDLLIQDGLTPEKEKEIKDKMEHLLHAIELAGGAGEGENE